MAASTLPKTPKHRAPRSTPPLWKKIVPRKLLSALVLLTLLFPWGPDIYSVSYRQQLQHPTLTATLSPPGESLEPKPNFLADELSALFQFENLGPGFWPSRLIPLPLSLSPYGNAVPTDSARPRPPPAG